ncbi:hypothetical protein KRR38_33875 [Novosphingobium sp. G106]|uniref:hypothetical protein n=1 Tax=Novosphingobium sp. G106 TaxID=2849500 RepID=UPI001C2DA120|nr:hypothetical protein [Novosphingobium sp. G106]MBV1692491.1 hypothetical protein [Novosphingobium sp. G106]
MDITLAGIADHRNMPDERVRTRERRIFEEREQTSEGFVGIDDRKQRLELRAGPGVERLRLGRSAQTLRKLFGDLDDLIEKFSFVRIDFEDEGGGREMVGHDGLLVICR